MKKVFLMITVLMTVVSMFAGIANLSSYASFSAAVTAIGTTRTTLVLDVSATVPAGGLTIPTTLQLKTAMELITLNGDLAINGPFEAGLHQVFTGNGTVTFGVEAVKEIYPEWWGAVGDGSTDCTDAINKAIQATLSISNVQVTLNTYGYMTGGGTLKFSPGVYDVTSIDLSDSVANAPTHSIKIIGSGHYATFIRGTQSGAIVVDALGRGNITLEDLTINTANNVTPQTGLLLARMQNGGMGCHNTLNRVYINGNFSFAAAVWISSGFNRWDTGELVNTSSNNNYCSFLTSPNNTLYNITSTHGTIISNVNTIPNTFIHVSFITYNNNSTPILLHQNAAATFVGCTVGGSGTGTKFVTYINDASDGYASFRGPVRWIGTDWEAPNGDSAVGTVHYFMRGGSVTSIQFKDILDEGGEFAFMYRGTQCIIDNDGLPFTLYNVVIKSAGLALGNSTLYIQAKNIYNCSFNIFDPFADAIHVNVTGTNVLSSLGRGYRTGTGSPFNAVNPDFIGEEYLDTSTNVWWKASVAAGNYWYPITSLLRFGTVSPVNNVTPAFVGDEYLNTSTNVWWKSNTNAAPNNWHTLY